MIIFHPLFTPRVLVVYFDPLVNGKSLSESHNDPREMTREITESISKASKGKVRYRIAEEMEVADFPQFTDERKYTADQWLSIHGNTSLAWKDGDDWARFDYAKAAKEWNLYRYDEVWMWGAGYFGFWESRMVGQRSFFVNAPPLEVEKISPKIFMGFNYERETDMALHAYGHRIESIMRRADPHRWAAWLSAVGTVHTAKGQVGEYQYGEEGHAKYIQRWHNSMFPEWWKYVAKPQMYNLHKR